MSKNESRNENKSKNNDPKFESAVFFVKDVEKSKKFFVDILGQKILMDFGRNVGFEGGFAIWEADYALNTIFEENASKITIGGNNAEIYFEVPDLDGLLHKLKKEGIDIIHPIREHPWGQRGFRFYDPDHHIIEVSEPMFNVVARMYQNGMDTKEIQKKSMMSKEFIEMVIESIKK
jgi:catechol 2,3-dioxygenase-like lactoylglutathione lyase family enzyme